MTHNIDEVVAQMRERARDLLECAELLTRHNAQQAAERARQLVPVDSGELKSSISAEEGSVTATAPHAAMVEYGTSRMAARPYMLPAARAQAETFFREAREVIK